MFRQIATIGFLCISAGSIAAEKVATQNTIDDSKIEKALADLLDKRAAWGPGPSQAAASATAANNRQALKEYLIRRESWGTAPKKTAASANQDAPLTLAAYLARRDAWGTAPAVTSADNRSALKEYLAQRESWGTAPQSVAISNRQPPLTLGAYLARRDAWASHQKAKIAHAGIPASTPGVQAAKAHPSPVANNPDATVLAAELARILSERASWGTSPAIRSAEAHVSQSVVAERAINRRTQERSPAETRVAAFSNATLSDGVTCTEALHQIARSSKIHFALGSAVLTSVDSGKLEKLAEAGRDCAGIRLRIEGHTDSLGDAAKNQALSHERAAAVAKFLKNAGFSAAALEAVGHGETRPLVPNTTRANRARNRRIEFVLLTN